MSLWGGVVVGVGLGYPMLLYYVCHEEMLFALRHDGIRGRGCVLGTCISKFAASLVTGASFSEGISRAVVAWNCA